MRHLMLSSLTCFAVMAAPLVSAEDAHKELPKAEAAKDAKAVNTLDPLTGKEVVAEAGTLEMTYDKKTIVVGFSSKESLAKAKAGDEKLKALIAKGAKHHQIIKDGALTDVEAKHEKKK
jgi:hypothetical protein